MTDKEARNDVEDDAAEDLALTDDEAAERVKGGDLAQPMPIPSPQHKHIAGVKYE